MRGTRVDNFLLKDENGNVFELFKNLSNKLLLVFFTKVNSSVCSTQLRNYNINYEKFINEKIKLVGINIDSLESHKNFCNELNLRFPLLSDNEKVVSTQFNTLNFLDVNKRTLVLIDENKIIRYYENMIPFKYLKTDEILSNLRKDNII